MMLIQEKVIQRVRALCAADERLEAALMYGSFSKGEGDAFSDIEFYLFIKDHMLSTVDQRAWLGQIAPIFLYFVNEFGVGTAVFHNLVRGEFHFEPASQISQVRTWQRLAGWPAASAMLVLDRTGELSDCLQEIAGEGPDRRAEAQQLWHQFLNWMLFGRNVLDRGELARALELLHIVHRHLLWLARLAVGASAHWQTPSQGLEEDLPPHMYARFVQCTADLRLSHLQTAYDQAWRWGLELATLVAAQQAFDQEEDLVHQLTQRFAETSSPTDGRGSLGALQTYGLELIEAARFPGDYHPFIPSSCSNCGVVPFSLTVTHHIKSTQGDFKGLIDGQCQVCGAAARIARSGEGQHPIRETNAALCVCGGRMFLVGQVTRFEGDEGLRGFFDEAVIVAQCIRCQRHQHLATID